jgi:hypothetical protein
MVVVLKAVAGPGGHDGSVDFDGGRAGASVFGAARVAILPALDI